MGVLLSGGNLKVSAKTIRNLLLVCFASAVMALLLYFGQEQFNTQLVDAGLFVRIIAILGLVCISAIAYFAIVIVTGAIPRDQLKWLAGKR